MCVTICVARTCTASAIAFCFSGSVSRANSSRSLSISGSHGQPNIALSQAELKKPVKLGFEMSAETHAVRKACHPPAFGGSFLARRATKVCQSIDCISTLNPAFSISDFATGAKLVSAWRSVECISTIGVPSYPASFKSTWALLKSEFNIPSMPVSVESGLPREIGLALLVELRVADYRLQKVFLIEGIEQC